MNIRTQLLVALALTLSGGLLSAVIVLFPPSVDQQEPPSPPPKVQVSTINLQSFPLSVRSQGRVMAKTEIDLVSGVSGNIVKISSDFVSGGFFKRGDLLVSIDPAEYDLRVAQAQARVTEAQYQLVREKAEADQARDEWKYLGQGEPNPLSLRIPQLKEKQAKLSAEQEELKNARLLRQRTDIRAPFDGRLRTAAAGMGQYISNGSILGRIYSSDLAEVRLPVSADDLALIDFTDAPGDQPVSSFPAVQLTAQYQGKLQKWTGHIVRSEGVIDPETGMIILIAQIADPLGLKTDKAVSSNTSSSTSTLPIGLYVEAVIAGRTFDKVVTLPASALHKEHQIVVVEPDNRLSFRSVDVLRREQENIIIRSGLIAGERVMVSGMHHPIAGLTVTPIEIPQ